MFVDLHVRDKLVLLKLLFYTFESAFHWFRFSSLLTMLVFLSCFKAFGFTSRSHFVRHICSILNLTRCKTSLFGVHIIQRPCLCYGGFQILPQVHLVDTINTTNKHSFGTVRRHNVRRSFVLEESNLYLDIEVQMSSQLTECKELCNSIH